MNETSVGREKNLKPLFQFLSLFTTTAHIYSEQASESLLIVFPPNRNLSLLFPLSFYAPLQHRGRTFERTNKPPTPGSTDQFSCHLHREFSIGFCADAKRDGTGIWHEQRRGALYCVIFYTHTFYPTSYKVLFCIRRRERKRTEGKWQISALKGERRNVAAAMEWNGLEEKKREGKIIAAIILENLY